ncbi:MAG: DUF4912 domain-containing protein [Planctomycetota bacterium]|jgi:hypothetical protein|nr:DUF4912 domain-containing protein [Planctomycetota bacterium]
MPEISQGISRRPAGFPPDAGFGVPAGIGEAGGGLARHFRDNFSILLDGSLSRLSSSSGFVRLARKTLRNARDGAWTQFPGALRETLASIEAKPLPFTGAGLAAIGPRSARVWWDCLLLEDAGGGGSRDVLAGLGKPRPVLRFYDTTGLPPGAGGWNSRFDVDIELAAGGRTVDFWAADRSYRVEVGHLHLDGRFQRLAAANPLRLPREGKGKAGEGVHVRALPPREKLAERLVPLIDAEVRKWVGARPDCPERDFQAELAIHALYLGYLREGPRALRGAPKPVRRGREALAGEYRERRGRESGFSRSSPALPFPSFRLVAERLDGGGTVSPRELAHPPAVSPAAKPLAGASVPPPEFLALLRGVRAHPETARRPGGDRGIRGFFASAARPDLPTGEPARSRREGAGRDSDLVRFLGAEGGRLERMAESAAPVFAAAAILRRRLAALGMAPAPAKGKPMPGGREAGLFARAGVRFTGLSLRLEGKIRDGSRLRVAGKPVPTDPEGRFSLECPIAGRRASLPLRAAGPSGPEARGRLEVEWNGRRPAKLKVD